MDERRTHEYLKALALAHMLSPANSNEEDLLVDALNAAEARTGVDVTPYQLAAGETREALGFGDHNE